MPIVQQAQGQAVDFTGLDLLTNALTEINAVAPGDPVQAATVAWTLGKANRLLDQWAAQKRFVYSITLGRPFTLVPGLSPHTIGPSGATFDLALRPVKIQNANLILNNVTPVVKRPLFVRQGPEGEKWYAAKTVPGIQTSIPTELYYQPDWPNGSLFFWPVPSVAYQVEVGTWDLLGSVTLNGNYSFPPGYAEALTLSLAESMWSAFHQGEPVDESLRNAALGARAIIASNNIQPPLMPTRDPGTPQSGRKSYFNWMDGSMVPSR